MFFLANRGTITFFRSHKFWQIILLATSYPSRNRYFGNSLYTTYLSGDQLLGQFDGVVDVFWLLLVLDLEQQLYEVVPVYPIGFSEVDSLPDYAQEELLHFKRERAKFQRLEQFREEHPDYFGQRWRRGRVEYRASHPSELGLRISQRVAFETESTRTDHIRREFGRQVTHFEFRLSGLDGCLNVFRYLHCRYTMRYSISCSVALNVFFLSNILVKSTTWIKSPTSLICNYFH